MDDSQDEYETDDEYAPGMDEGEDYDDEGSFGDEDDMEGDSEFPSEGDDEEALGAPEIEEENIDDVEGDRDNAADWDLPDTLPPATWEAVSGLLDQYSDEGRQELTCVVLGKTGSGVSSTVNALLGQQKFSVRPGLLLRPGEERLATLEMRKTDSFLLRVVHTHWILNGVRFGQLEAAKAAHGHRCKSKSQVNLEAIQAITDALQGRRVDLLIWVDRLDSFRVDPADHAVWKELKRVWRPNLMPRITVVFTYGCRTPPSSTNYEALSQQRTQQMRKALKQYGAHEAPVAIVEHGSRCMRNNDGEKQLRDGTVWHAALWEMLTQAALTHSGAASVATVVPNPNRRGFWQIPLLLAVQVALRILMHKRIDEDGIYGDHNGPYTKRQIRMEKKRRAEREPPRNKLEALLQ